MLIKLSLMTSEMFFMTRTLVTVQNLCFYVIAALKREVQEMRLPLTFGGVLE
jgi:hypothetical protein